MSVLRNRGSLIATIFVSAAALGYFLLVYSPAAREIESLRQSLDEKQDRILLGARLGAQINETRAQRRRVLNKLESLRAELPREVDLAAFYAQIARESAAAGAGVKRLEPQAVEQLATLSKAGATLSVEGSFDQVFTLVKRLDQLPSPCWVKTLRLEAADESGERLRGEIDFVVFAARNGKSD